MNIHNFLEEKKFSRRTFLKGMAALGALIGLEGYSSGLVHAAEGAKEALTEESEGEWKNAACWHNCGGCCVLKAEVKDGTVTRLKTDQSHDDSYDYPQQRACVRGLSQRAQVLGKERLKYPMKRTHFDPTGMTGKELRGQDTWERISWDEALDIVADQLKKAKDNYGNESIYVVDGGNMQRPLSDPAFGGFVQKSGSRSQGCWKSAMTPILGTSGKKQALSDRYELLSSKLIILWGNNPAQTSMGMSLLNIRRAKERGARVIAVDPVFSRSAAVLADDFYQIRPATDTTLLLALAYVIIQEDLKVNKKYYDGIKNNNGKGKKKGQIAERSNAVIDWDFLDNCVQGFDAAHMPEGSNTEENFYDYVLGTYDMVPKTPEWASKICGLPVDRINKLAKEIMNSKPVTCYFSWNSARVEAAHHVCIAQMALGAMTGNLGIKGGCFACSNQEAATNGGSNLIGIGKDNMPKIPDPLFKLCTNHHWEDILSGKRNAGQGKGFKPIDIRVIYHSHSATLNQTNNTNKGIQAHKKVDFVVTNHFTFSPECQYSDVVLPVTTPWEKAGEVLQGNREAIVWSQKVIEPYFEAKDDAWIAEQVGLRLGVDPSVSNPMSEEQRTFNIIASSTVLCDDGKTKENLVSITEADLAELGVKGTPQSGRIPILELRERGVYQVERHEGDNFGFNFFAKLRQDPVANPLGTESGKLELYSPALKAAIDKAGWNEGYAYAKYVPPTEGYEATFSDFENGVKGEYPFQVISNHDLRGTHSVYNQVGWLREAFTYELEINPADAKAAGLAENDTAEIYNSRGAILRKVHLTERVMPGVLVIHEGTWLNLNADGKCIGGSPNVLTGDFPSGPDVESWGAVIANVRKSDVVIEDDWKVDLGVEV